jgi:hypothetical protein
LGLGRCGLYSRMHGRIEMFFTYKIKNAGLFERIACDRPAICE